MRWFFPALALVALIPAALAAQQRQCSFTTGGFSEASAAQPGMIIIHDPFVFTCSDGVTLSAGSGRLNQITDEAYFVGDVFFQDATNSLRAQEATYNAQTAHLIARNDVRFEDRAQGSTLEGQNLEYFRATEFRPVAQMTATDRPTLLLYPAAASGRSPDPIRLIGNRVEMQGSSRLRATGDVTITRTDLDARGEEVIYDAAGEELELRRGATIVSEGRELAGEMILARLANGAIEYVRSTTGATMQSEELYVAGDDLQLFFAGEELQRAVAVGDSEADPPVIATARAESFELTADSLDAQFVGPRLDQVIAIGDARGATTDSSSSVAPAAPIDPALVDPVAAAFASDWVRGDTIIGYFAPAEEENVDIDALPVDPSREIIVQGAEPSNEVDLERIVAIGSAQSVYRLAGTSGGSAGRTNLNFLVGERIELELAEGQMSVARVEGLQYGIYLEPQTGGQLPAVPETPGGPAAEPTGVEPEPFSAPEPAPSALSIPSVDR